MVTKTLTLCAVTTSLATALSLAVVTNTSAESRWGAAAVGAGVGRAVGAVAAAAASPYYGSGYYNYAPGYTPGYAPAYAPGFAPGGAIGSSGPIYDATGASWYSQGDCRFNVNNC